MNTTETEFQIHDVESAPEPSREMLAGVQRSYGMIPNVVGVLAGSPAALAAYTDLQRAVGLGDLSPAERQLVQLTIAAANRCAYGVAVHSSGGLRAGTPQAAIDGVRDGTALADARLEALRSFTGHVVDRRGWVADEALDGFLAAGFERRHVLEILANVALKTLTNYTNHIAQPALDPAFAAARWDGPAATE
jgi:AhpD family alkylhydroperoxidase